MRQTMMRIWGVIWRGLLGALIALLLIPAVVPPFLDRIYYRGPATGHFDGRHFFNPEGEQGTGGAQNRTPWEMAWRTSVMKEPSPWPKHVRTERGYPAAAGLACPLKPDHVRENWARCVDRVDPKRMFVTWIGHSTVLVQAGGINILTDPIYAERSGPWGLFGPKRVRDPGIALDDLPHIDLILVSHNHWDHMDLPTLKRLWARDRPLIITGLGNDTILKSAGVPSIAEDWGGKVKVRPGITVTIERAHHWSSRWWKDKDRALWSGFAVTLPGGNLYYAGDTGPGDGSWVSTAVKDGPYRLALIPIGAFQPHEPMSGNHINPVEAVTAFQKLGAAYALGVHWGTFKLSSEGLYDPPNLLHATMDHRGIARGRFRAIEVGKNWEIPPLR
ncbi:MBL fold metallo-hydrolase [Sphingomonas sp.]|uniref:MBL fold metallo-hydrolase n=1 Tax=Sphingomonas sp. TaxID=28214 RepID=UPI003B3B0F8A